jgi:hypothetical protein
MWVESAAPIVDFLDDINFKVQDEAGRRLTYLPSMNSGRHKKVVVYFLPQIDPSETKPRKIVVNYRWPKMFAQLDKEGDEQFTWKLNSNKNITDAVFELYLEAGTGRILQCDFAGIRTPGDELEPCKAVGRLDV